RRGRKRPPCPRPARRSLRFLAWPTPGRRSPAREGRTAGRADVGWNAARSGGIGRSGPEGPPLGPGQRSYQRIVTKQAASVRTIRVTAVYRARTTRRVVALTG